MFELVPHLTFSHKCSWYLEETTRETWTELMCIIYYIFVILKETKTLRYEDIISKYAVIRFCQFVSILRSLFCSSRYGSLFNQCEILNNDNFMIR